ncbi:RDD family protein [Mesorhizobium marinum]|uniref:RDD family protein n=1 Tax=Mesorhizobium marinum TaxID=3228790 RepID=UPI003F5B5FFC
MFPGQARTACALERRVNTGILNGEIIATRLDDVRAYDGVRTRRIMAFLLDYLIVAILLIPFAILVAVLGLLTFGLGWALFGILGPAVALIYIWNTLGGPNQATIGMRMAGIRLDRLDGRPVDGMLAVVHSVLFWAANVVLTPLVLLVSLFADRKRTLHDLLLGTAVTRADR